ncbi:MAG: neutral zinc metallopeptidase [Bacteroidales bacterium]|jgi:predicted metalloprotease|nr:neutral zinc metallopeptidase [Bacteroidales bacterium]
MKLEGRRESTNVEDRRGKKTVAAAGGIGLGGIIIYLIISLMGGDASAVMEQMQQGNTTEYVDDGTDYSQVDAELMTFCKRILAGTEDVWTKEFKKMGRTYQPPKMVIFSDAVNSGCGNATSASGPFYCSADETVYLDLEFFKSMKKQIGADGDFAYAYVIAHEVGHHVQNQLGILGQAHQQMAQYGRNTKQSNEISVRLELQADFFAGVWAYNDNKMFGSLEDGDIEEALNAAAKIGDDYLQKQAYGRTMPETFNHGTSAQRERWLKKGLTTGDINLGDTFSPSYNSL